MAGDFLFFLFPNQHKFVVLEGRKTLVVAKIIDPPVSGFVNVCKVIEIETLLNQFAFVGGGFIIGV